MAHPHASHRQSRVEHSRASRIAKGYATGGAVKGEAGLAIRKKAVSQRDALAVTGDPPRERLDKPRRARGGRTNKNGKTNVNVIIAGHGAPAAPMAAGAGPAPVPPVPAPRPPMAGPGGPPVAPPGMPVPGGPMPPRSQGGRAFAKGGAVHRDTGGLVKQGVELGSRGGGSLNAAGNVIRIPDGASSGLVERLINQMSTPKGQARGGVVKRASGGAVKAEGMRAGTQVQHTDGKSDTKNVGRGKVVTYATGGAVEAPKGKAGMGPKLPGGARGGLARLAKERRAERKHG